MSDHENPVRHQHDHGYKHLLSSKQIFLEMLRSFVKRGWVDQVDEAHVIKVDKSFILPDFRGKEADVVYRLKIKDSEVIFYLLIDELIGLFNRLGPTIDQLSEEQRGQFAIWLKHMLRRLTKTKKTEQELDFIITEFNERG